ncbi:MAG: transcriptional regulator [Candidatus Cloacimonetes bacterium]|nr:transcriptional regulator [Candidatus Cloacimonadota bacterium]
MIENNETIPESNDSIDRLIHEPARLKIILYLYVVESADFVYLLRQTGLTKGNLSAHLQKLEHNGYVEITKEFLNRIPRTLISLTERGKTAFEEYRVVIKEMLNY